MKMARIALGMIMMAGLSACSGGVPGKAPFETLPQGAPVAPAGMTFAEHAPAPTETPARRTTSAEMSRNVVTLSDAPINRTALVGEMTLVDYEVRIPESLKVSESNSFYPIADIVWRGDAYGNRKEQIGAIFRTVLEDARAHGGSGRPVKAIVTLSMFHALTERTRYSIGGWHEIRFTMSLVDATTGEVLVKDRPVRADLEGYGGKRAIEAERQGLTQKVRITSHLQRVMRAELTQPGGWGRKDTNLKRAVDQI